MSQHQLSLPTSLPTSPTLTQLPRRTRARFGTTLAAAAALALGAIALGPASPALAHDQLVGSEIVSKADGTAEAILLTFSNSVIAVGTEFVLTGADGADATGGAPEVAGPDVTQPIAPGLDAGDYTGAWRVVSSDGHPIDGAFTLSVAADGSATLQDATETEEHAHEDGEEEAHDHEATNGAADEASSGLGTGAVIGIAGGGIVVVAIAVLLITRRRGAAAGTSGTSQADTDSNDTTGGSN